MAIFLYNGVQSGKKISGEISASDLKSASVKLREKKNYSHLNEKR